MKLTTKTKKTKRNKKIVAMNQLEPGDLTKFAAIDKIERERDTEFQGLRVSLCCSYSCFFLSSFFIELVPKKGESLRAASATSAKDTDFLQFL
jgi:hypothetical protein